MKEWNGVHLKCKLQKMLQTFAGYMVILQEEL